MDIIIDESTAGRPLLYTLTGRLSLSHRCISRLKRIENGITLNGAQVTVRKVPQVGDILALALEDRSEDENPDIISLDYPLNILYEDEYIIIPDKPACMPTHPSRNHHGDCLANALASYFSSRAFVFRPVNRLDRDTSGAVIIAKDKATAARMSALIEKRLITKKYIAILDGVPIPPEGFISAYIRRKQESIITREATEKPLEGSKPALTEYRTLCFADNISAVECLPLTGRTHQLRVHFSYLGCPILGDSLYGKESGLISRQALHAYFLEFTHPVTGKPITVRSPLPDDMRKVLERFKLDLMTTERI